jgi:type 1 fimbria pilin
MKWNSWMLCAVCCLGSHAQVLYAQQNHITFSGSVVEDGCSLQLKRETADDLKNSVGCQQLSQDISHLLNHQQSFQMQPINVSNGLSQLSIYRINPQNSYGHLVVSYY